MLDSPYKYMKLGIVHFMAYPETLKGEGPVLETLKKIAEDEFFTAVEISWIKNSSDREKVRGLIESSHLTVAYGAQPRLLVNKLDLNSMVEDERRRAVEEVKVAIEEAVYLKAEGVAVLSGHAPDSDNREKALGFLMDSLRELSQFAREKGLNLTLETFDQDIDKKCLIGPVEDAVRVTRELRGEYNNFGLMLDLSHFPLQSAGIRETLNKAKDFLTHVHLGNCVMKDINHLAYGDQHPRFGIPGGENDIEEVREFLHALFDIGFLGERQKLPIVSFEVKPLPGESSEIVIANAKRVFTQAWANLHL